MPIAAAPMSASALTWSIGDSEGETAVRWCRTAVTKRTATPAQGPPGATLPAVTARPSAGLRLTEEQRLLRDAVATLADERIAPRAAEIDRSGEFPWDVKTLLAEHDVLALPFPERHGGLGGDLLTVCLAIEQLSRVCATSGLILAVQELGALPLLLAGSDEQQARWFPDLAAGRTLIAFALTEAEAGSDAAAVRTRAVRDGDDYVIDGTKRFISQGSVADLVAVFAVTDPEADRHRHLSCFIVATDAPGFRVSGSSTRWASAAARPPSSRSTASACPLDHRVGAEGEGFSLAMRTLDRSRPGIAAQAVGIAQGALEVARAVRPRATPVRPADRRVPDDPGPCWPTWTPRPRRRASSSTRPARRSTPARPTPAAGRRCVNSSPATRRCG